jgi:hypothetical protein
VTVQAEHYTVKFRVGQYRFALCFHQLGSVDLAQLFSEIGKHIIVIFHWNKLISHFNETVNENGFHLVF